ncbi:hypothetical protein RCL_jg2715.t1 [Rhizophagus clarus]|uniref:Uncharacterized protein n=1 Tax=Rhizophagus clarus TaxID=94130 RepID=A0A8H3M8G6_9GLOM|nr:hypothetical protein RCL_jg2715.t1 [Rhizophagus clarus]
MVLPSSSVPEIIPFIQYKEREQNDIKTLKLEMLRINAPSNKLIETGHVLSQAPAERTLELKREVKPRKVPTLMEERSGGSE